MTVESDHDYRGGSDRDYRGAYGRVLGNYRWPLLSTVFGAATSTRPRRWTSLNPEHFSPQRGAEVDRRGIELQASGGCPEFELVAVMAATMAVVPAQGHIDREGRTARRKTSRQGAGPVPLIASAAAGFEAQQFQHLPHRNFRTQPVEVDTGHLVARMTRSGFSSGKEKKDRSVPTISIGNAERSSFDAQSTRCQPASVRRI